MLAMFVDAEPRVAFAVPLNVMNAVLLYEIPDNGIGEETAIDGDALTIVTVAFPMTELPFTLAVAVRFAFVPMVLGRVQSMAPNPMVGAVAFVERSFAVMYT